MRKRQICRKLYKHQSILSDAMFSHPAQISEHDLKESHCQKDDCSI